jgi:type VI protein secretion system component VasK
VTYALVMTILVLALIAVVVAVVFSTDEHLNTADADLVRHQLEPESSQVPTQPTDTAIEEENPDRADRIVDLPEEADRDARPVGL